MIDVNMQCITLVAISHPLPLQCLSAEQEPAMATEPAMANQLLVIASDVAHLMLFFSSWED